MAEQSIGMATGTGVSFGDGNVGTGYPTSRMTEMETKTLSNGVLFIGNNLSMSFFTSTLTISDGAAIVGGFFYENTSSVNISVLTGVADGTYNVVILANDTAGAVTVTRSASGTTVLARTVRLCIATNAQLVGKVYLQIGQIDVAATNVVGEFRDVNRFGTSTVMPYQSYAFINGGSATLTTANTAVAATSYASAGVTSDLTYDAFTSGEIHVLRLGLYAVSVSATFSTGTTGSRVISVLRNGVLNLTFRQAAAGTASHRFMLTGFIEVTALPTVLTVTGTASLATQTFDSVNFLVSRA